MKRVVARITTSPSRQSTCRLAIDSSSSSRAPADAIAADGGGDHQVGGGLSTHPRLYRNLLTGVLISARVTKPERHTVSPMNAAQCCSEATNCPNP